MIPPGKQFNSIERSRRPGLPVQTPTETTSQDGFETVPMNWRPASAAYLVLSRLKTVNYSRYLSMLWHSEYTAQ